MLIRLFTLFFLFALSFSDAKNILVKNFGAIGDGIHDDSKAINNAYRLAKKHPKSYVIFEKNKVYLTTQPIEITTNTFGNNATLKPRLKTRALFFQKDNIHVESLHIKGNEYPYININKNNISFSNCNIHSEQYFILLSINGDYFSLNNCHIKNTYSSGRAFALHSITGKSHISVENSTIDGAIYFESKKSNHASDYLFNNNTFNVNYSHLEQNLLHQNDAVHFRAISDVVFTKNTFNFKNLNRGFKFTDHILKTEQGKNIGSQYPPSGIYFLHNKINFDCNNGKQLFDFFFGTTHVNIVGNIIKSRGATTIFENKTNTDIQKKRFMNISNNIIHFDATILFLKGSDNYSTFDNTLLFKNNTLIYDAEKFKSSQLRIGQDIPVPFNYVIDVRGVKEFTYEYNQLSYKQAKPPFRKRNFFFIKNTEKTVINQNKFAGNISVLNEIKTGSFTLKKNSISSQRKKPLIWKGLNKKTLINKNNIIF